MHTDVQLRYEELDALDAPLEWWEHVGYWVAIAGGVAAIAT
ncbi:MAG: MpaA3 family daptide-type RiPP [Actinomycetota bacterium]